MKKYELKFIDTARKKVPLSSIYMSKIISPMFFLNHGFYFVTILDGDHKNEKVCLVAAGNNQFTLHIGWGIMTESVVPPKVENHWVCNFALEHWPS